MIIGTRIAATSGNDRLTINQRYPIITSERVRMSIKKTIHQFGCCACSHKLHGGPVRPDPLPRSSVISRSHNGPYKFRTPSAYGSPINLFPRSIVYTYVVKALKQQEGIDRDVFICNSFPNTPNKQNKRLRTNLGDYVLTIYKWTLSWFYRVEYIVVKWETVRFTAISSFATMFSKCVCNTDASDWLGFWLGGCVRATDKGRFKCPKNLYLTI